MHIKDWDTAYKSGSWEGKGDDANVPRYAVLGRLLSPGSSVLDVGCGLGFLRSYIERPQSYTGIDISKVAMEGIQDRRENEQFLCARIEDWRSDKLFDAIVLNGVLYYLQNPGGVLQRLADMLTPGGVLVVSIYKHPSWFSPNHRALSLARRFLATQPFEILEDIRITRGKTTWSIISGARVTGRPV